MDSKEFIADVTIEQRCFRTRRAPHDISFLSRQMEEEWRALFADAGIRDTSTADQLVGKMFAGFYQIDRLIDADGWKRANLPEGLVQPLMEAQARRLGISPPSASTLERKVDRLLEGTDINLSIGTSLMSTLDKVRQQTTPD